MDCFDIMNSIDSENQLVNYVNCSIDSKNHLVNYVNCSIDLDNNDTQIATTNQSNNKIYLPKKTNKKIYITKSGAFIKFEYIGDVNSLNTLKKVRKIENYFTIKTMQLIGSFKQVKCCKVDKKKKHIIVPRFGIFEILNKKYSLDGYYTISQLQSGQPPSSPFNWIGTLRNNQPLIVDYIKNNYFTKKHVRRGSAGCILNLEAGQGKTYVASYFIGHIKRKTAVILHSTSMIKQWANDLRSCYGNDIKIGYYYSKKKVEGDIMLIVVNSATNSEFKFKNAKTGNRVKSKADSKVNSKTESYTTYNAIDFYNQFGLVIMDECHLYANNFCGKVFRQAQTPYVLGLSATPDENINNFDRLVWWGIGPVLDAKTIPGYVSTDDTFTGEVHRIQYYGAPNYTRVMRNKITDIVSTTDTITMICSDDKRSDIVIYCIKECLKKNLFTFVFADRRDYLEILRNKLIAETTSGLTNAKEQTDIMTDDKDYIRIVGGSKDEELAIATEKSRVIFTTYQYMGTGKSIVKMNGLVLATPRKSKMKQYIKRIFRLGSDTTIKRHIYDIVDMKTTLKNQWYVRNKYYKDKNFDISEEKHTFKDKTKTTNNKVKSKDKSNDKVKSGDTNTNDKPLLINKKRTSLLVDKLMKKIN